MEKFEQSQAEHDLLDKYRDNNWHVVYKCPTCGFRGVGPSVTLHPYSHGPMIREAIVISPLNVVKLSEAFDKKE